MKREKVFVLVLAYDATRIHSITLGDRATDGTGWAAGVAGCMVILNLCSGSRG